MPVRSPLVASTEYPPTLLFASSAVYTYPPPGTTPTLNTPVPKGKAVTWPGVSTPDVASMLNTDTVSVPIVPTYRNFPSGRIAAHFGPVAVGKGEPTGVKAPVETLTL